MKRIIGTLCICMMFTGAGCAADKEQQATVEAGTETDTVTESSDKEQTQESEITEQVPVQDPAEPYDYYDELIAAVTECIVTKNDKIAQDYDFSYIYYMYSSDSIYGYLIKDIDGNGTDELIFGGNDTVFDSAWNGVIYDMYTISDGEPVHLLCGGERDRYYLCENGRIANEGSGGAAYTFYGYYDLEGAQLQLAEAVIYDGWRDADNPWFYLTGSENTEDAVSVTADQAESVIGKYVYEHPVFIPFVETEKAVGSYTRLREARDIHAEVLRDEEKRYYVSIPERKQSEEKINSWLRGFYEEEQKNHDDFMGIGIVESDTYLTEKERKERYYAYNTVLQAERADDVILSFYGSTYTYSGGNHGNRDTYGVNFDTGSGSRIELNDILFDREQFFIFARDYVGQNYGDYAEEFTRMLGEGGEKLKDTDWCMDGYGINFLYDGVNWNWQYRIPYEKLVDYLKPEYFPTSKEADYSLYMGVGAVMDVNGDNILDVVTQPEKNGDIYEIGINGTVSRLSLEWNGVSFAEEVSDDNGGGSFSLRRDEEGVTRLRWKRSASHYPEWDWVFTYRIDGETVVLEDIVRVRRRY
ncbi:MAG: hypothetical protein NC086_10125 [Alistipes sp.]|nr:hypothetical protein [Alistipes sp.]